MTPVVLFINFNQSLPQELINSLNKRFLLETNSGLDYNRYCKEFRTEKEVINIAKKYPELFTIQELTSNVISFNICMDETGKEWIEAMILKPRFKIS